MPEQTITRRPRTIERRVAHLFCQFVSTEIDVHGRVVEVARTARRGELTSFSATEAARLDALGALAPEGHTPEMIEADIAATYQAYADARRQAVDDGSVF